MDIPSPKYVLGLASLESEILGAVAGFYSITLSIASRGLHLRRQYADHDWFAEVWWVLMPVDVAPAPDQIALTFVWSPTFST